MSKLIVCSDKVKKFIYSLPYDDTDDTFVYYCDIGDQILAPDLDRDSDRVQDFFDGMNFVANAKHDIYILDYSVKEHIMALREKPAKHDYMQKTEVSEIADTIDDEEDVCGVDETTYTVLFDAVSDDDVISKIKASYETYKSKHKNK